jgi:hypothetical protein
MTVLRGLGSCPGRGALFPLLVMMVQGRLCFIVADILIQWVWLVTENPCGPLELAESTSKSPWVLSLLGCAFSVPCAVVEAKERLKKLDDRATVWFFVGYKYQGGGYRVWDPERPVVVESRDASWTASHHPLCVNWHVLPPTMTNRSSSHCQTPLSNRYHLPL